MIRRAPWRRHLLALLLGLLSVGGFAPFGLFPLPLITLAGLLWLWRDAASARRGATLGFAFGWGLFMGGVSWLYVALHDVGGMPAPLAALAIALFCAYLALYPALAGWLTVRLQPRSPWRFVLLAASAWMLTESLRGWVFTGFPWLALGYAQTPPSPLAGYAAVLGVYGLSWLSVFGAGLLAMLFAWRASRAAAVGVAVALVAGGVLLAGHPWTEPIGAPFTVRLVQTNIPQTLKWQPEMLGRWLDKNNRLAREGDAALTILPETTLPLLAEQLPPDYLPGLEAFARARGADILFGVFQRDGEDHIYNSALSLGAHGVQGYAKHHLVPFGEYSPPAFGWVYQWLSIPMSDQTRGRADQPPLHFGDQRVAINICYEDLFGAEIARAVPQATLLLNLSNLAWYGDSFAQPQHLQIARLRALETGRPMLRATNTGMTAIVAPDGRVTHVLPPFVAGAIEAPVRGFRGLTPYVRLGDGPVTGASLAVLLAAWLQARRRGAERAH